MKSEYVAIGDRVVSLEDYEKFYQKSDLYLSGSRGQFLKQVEKAKECEMICEKGLDHV